MLKRHERDPSFGPNNSADVAGHGELCCCVRTAIGTTQRRGPYLRGCAGCGRCRRRYQSSDTKSPPHTHAIATAVIRSHFLRALIDSAWTSQTPRSLIKTKTTATLRSFVATRSRTLSSSPARKRSSISHRAATDRPCACATATRDTRSLAHHISRIRSLWRSRRARTRHPFQTRSLVGSVQSKRSQRRLSDQRRQAVPDSDCRQQHECRTASRADTV